MKTLELKNIIQENKAYFEALQLGNAFYRITVPTGELREVPDADIASIADVEELHNTYTFPIPLDDIGTTSLRYEMKAVECMKWIRKALEDGTFDLIISEYR